MCSLRIGQYVTGLFKIYSQKVNVSELGSNTNDCEAMEAEKLKF